MNYNKSLNNFAAPVRIELQGNVVHYQIQLKGAHCILERALARLWKEHNTQKVKTTMFTNRKCQLETEISELENQYVELFIDGDHSSLLKKLHNRINQLKAELENIRLSSVQVC